MKQIHPRSQTPNRRNSSLHARRCCTNLSLRPRDTPRRATFSCGTRSRKAFDLYEVKASNSGEDKKQKDLYTYDLAFQKIVLDAKQVPLGRLYLVRLNSNYVRGRLRARYERRLKELGFAVNSARLAEIHLHFPDLRAIANRIEFEFGRGQGRGLALSFLNVTSSEQVRSSATMPTNPVVLPLNQTAPHAIISIPYRARKSLGPKRVYRLSHEPVDADAVSLMVTAGCGCETDAAAGYSRHEVGPTASD